MELINDINRLKSFVKDNKVEVMAKHFDNLRTARVELLVVPEVAGVFLVATAPTVLVFVNGKEVYRAGTFIDTMKLEQFMTKWNENINCLL